MTSLTKKLNINFLKHLFNYNDEIIKKLMIDPVSIYSVTPFEIADTISQIIKDKMGNDLVITDMTACIGGNTISFSKYFKIVNAIEINPKRCDFLKKNLKILKIKNVNIYNDDCFNIIENLSQDIIFIDPPWGGRKYKFRKMVDLYLSKQKLCDICNNLIDKCKLIILKVTIVLVRVLIPSCLLMR